MNAKSVLFLDFDGVLNSEASFRLEIRKGTERVCDTLSEIACSNLQQVLEKCPDLRIVVSSTWRLLHSLDDLRVILRRYGVDDTRVIDKTPATLSGERGREIDLWLNDHPKVSRFVIVDDDPSAHVFDDEVAQKDCLSIKTDCTDGLLLSQAESIIQFLQG